MIEKLSLTYCLQAGPMKPFPRDEHLILKSSLGHPGFEFLREAKSLANLGWSSLPRGDGDSWDVSEPSSISSATLGLREALRCLLRVVIGGFVSAPSPGRISSSALALAVILPVLVLLIVVGICLIWKQRRSKGN